jgi:TPP-dependent pyruvate/acetoin dehydrogenase alpha subunit
LTETRSAFRTPQGVSVDAAPETVTAPAELDVSLALELYRRMLVIRGVEDRVQSLFLRGEVHGTTHLYSGQEAVAVGFASVLDAGDRIACTYRGHGHLLAMGTDAYALLAELLGRETGLNGGRAGSMNMVDPDHGVLGCYGIVGGSIAAATGAALTLRGSGSIAVAYFGDGATNQAYFFECLNFAKVLGLPVVFVCENNGYGEYTPFEVVTAGGIVPRAAAMDLPVTQIDGMDVSAVREAATEIVSRVRGGAGPEFVEARTYRFVGHSRSDPGKYRPDGELDRWRERDPLTVASRLLRERLGVPAERVAEVEADVETELNRIQGEALAAPFPKTLSIPEFNDG